MTETSSQQPQGAEPAPGAPPAAPATRTPAAGVPTEPVAATISAGPARAQPAALPAPGRRSDRTFAILLVVAALIAVGGLAFAGGRLTAPAATAAGTGRNGGFNGGNGGFNGPFASGAPGLGRGAFGGGVLLTGTVESIANGTLTIKTANGNSVDVTISDSTTFHSQASATAGDVKTGSQVQVALELGGAGGPQASPGVGNGGPQASPGAGNGGARRSVTARDVTIVSP